MLSTHQSTMLNIEMKRYSHTLKETAHINTSDFCLLSFSLLKQISKRYRDIISEQMLNDLYHKYYALNYKETISDILMLLQKCQSFLDEDILVLTQDKVNHLVNDSNSNHSRRFFETRCANLYLENVTNNTYMSVSHLVDPINFYSQKYYGYKVVSSINTKLDAVQLITDSIFIFNDNIEMELKNDSSLYNKKDRQEKHFNDLVNRITLQVLDREKELIYSNNPGILKSNSPCFYHLLSVETKPHRSPDIYSIDNNKEGYSKMHPEVPFVASVSGTTFTLIKLLEQYITSTHSKNEDVEHHVHNIIQLFMATYVSRGYHSYNEMIDIYKDAYIQKLFNKNGVTLQLHLPDDILHLAISDAIDYTKTITMKHIVGIKLFERKRENERQAISDFDLQHQISPALLKDIQWLKDAKLMTFQGKTGIYLAFNNKTSFQQATNHISKMLGSEHFRIANRQNTLEMYPSLLLAIKQAILQQYVSDGTIKVNKDKNIMVIEFDGKDQLKKCKQDINQLFNAPVLSELKYIGAASMLMVNNPFLELILNTNHVAAIKKHLLSK